MAGSTTPDSETLSNLWEIANRAQDQVLSAISDMDTKAGSLVDFTAVVTGLYLVAGFGIRDIGLATCAAYRNAAFASLFVGIAAGLLAMLVAMIAWRTGKMAIFELGTLVKKTEVETADYVRAFVVSQLVHQFNRNLRYYDIQKRRVRAAMAVLVVAVANVGIFIAAATLAITTVCG